MATKALLAAAALALSLPALAGGGGYYIGATSAPAAGSTYSDILFFTSWENDSSCSSYTTTTSGVTPDFPASVACSIATNCQAVAPGAIVDGTSAKNGSYGFHVYGATGTAETAECSSSAIMATDTGCVLMQVYRIGTGSQNIFRSQVGTGRFQCGLFSSDIECYYTDGTNTITATSSGGVLPVSAWRSVEFCYDATAGTPIVKLRVFDDGGQVGSTFSSTTSTPGAMTTDATGWTLLTIGDVSGQAFDLYIDTIITSSDYNRDLQALRNLTASPR